MCYKSFTIFKQANTGNFREQQKLPQMPVSYTIFGPGFALFALGVVLLVNLAGKLHRQKEDKMSSASANK